MTGRRVPHLAVRPGHVVAGLALVLAAVLPACSSDSSSGSTAKASPTSSTALVPGTAKVVTFDVPATVKCQADSPATFTVSWKTSGATTTTVNVDGAPVPGAKGSAGSTQAQVHCDPLPHDVVIIATDSDGHFTTDRKILNTNTTPG
jgi:hypothetical protein